MTPEEAVANLGDAVPSDPFGAWHAEVHCLVEHAQNSLRLRQVTPGHVWRWERLAADLVDELRGREESQRLAVELFGQLVAIRGWLNGNGSDDAPVGPW